LRYQFVTRECVWRQATSRAGTGPKSYKRPGRVSQTLGEVVGEDARGFVPSGNLCRPRY